MKKPPKLILWRLANLNRGFLLIKIDLYFIPKTVIPVLLQQSHNLNLPFGYEFFCIVTQGQRRRVGIDFLCGAQNALFINVALRLYN